MLLGHSAEDRNFEFLKKTYDAIDVCRTSSDGGSIVYPKVLYGRFIAVDGTTNPSNLPNFIGHW